MAWILNFLGKCDEVLLIRLLVNGHVHLFRYIPSREPQVVRECEVVWENSRDICSVENVRVRNCEMDVFLLADVEENVFNAFCIESGCMNNHP